MGRWSRWTVGATAPLWGWVCLASGCVEQLADDGRPTYAQFRASAELLPGTSTYIVDGDIAVEGEGELRKMYDEMYGPGAAPLIKWTDDLGGTAVAGDSLTVNVFNGQDSKWSDTRKKQLTYCVGNIGTASQRAAIVADMKAAAEDWEAAADVDFIHVPAEDSNCNGNNNNVFFHVGGFYQANSGTLAYAFFPGNSRPNRRVMVNVPRVFSIPSNSSLTRVGIMRHELGHTLGFRHEFARLNVAGCAEGGSMRGLTSYDPNSVMQYPGRCGAGNFALTLSNLDRQGAASLYGAPNSTPDNTPPSNNPPANNPPNNNPPNNPPSNNPPSNNPPGNTPPSNNPPSTNPNPAPNPPGQVTHRQLFVGRGWVPRGRAAIFVATLPAGAEFSVLTSGSGNVDLFTRRGAMPTPSVYDCAPKKGDSAERCTGKNEQERSIKLYIAVYGAQTSQYTMRFESLVRK